MGTNYDLYPSSPCVACGREDEPLHIGKSSAGWVFALHVTPAEGINDLADWEARWGPPARIEDEYGRSVTPEGMKAIITDRKARGAMDDAWLQANHAERGPNNLARSHIDGCHCVGHGVGTWDLHQGEFS